MAARQRTYFCIDMKSFYASVECAERGLNPFETNLVVADLTRGKNALCLAITPKMKAQGIKNRCRLSEIPKNVRYEVAPPRMALYIEYAADIYSMYACADSDWALQLRDTFNAWFENNIPKHRFICEQIESPTAVFTGMMRYNGVLVDTELMAQKKAEAEAHLVELIGYCDRTIHRLIRDASKELERNMPAE